MTISAVFDWIKNHNKEPVPIELIPKFDGMEQCNDNGFTAAMAQIAYNRQMPQPELLHDPDYKDKEGYTLAHWWIWRVRTVPPNELLTKVRGPNKMTLAMYWAKEISKPVPEELINLQNPDDRDCIGRTLAMYWATYIMEPMPKTIYHNPYLCDCVGRVFQMYSWKFDHKEAPLEMQVSPLYTDYRGNFVKNYIEDFVVW